MLKIHIFSMLQRRIINIGITSWSKVWSNMSVTLSEVALHLQLVGRVKLVSQEQYFDVILNIFYYYIFFIFFKKIVGLKMSVKDFQWIVQHASYHIALTRSKKLNKLKTSTMLLIFFSESVSRGNNNCRSTIERNVSEYKKSNLIRADTHKQRTSLETSAGTENPKPLIDKLLEVDGEQAWEL